MTIPSFRHPNINGEFVRYDDHNKEVERLNGIINDLSSKSVNEIDGLITKINEMKPNQKSRFIIKYGTKDDYGYKTRYTNMFHHTVHTLNILSKDPNVSEIKVFALTEVPIVESLTLQLPE